MKNKIEKLVLQTAMVIAVSVLAVGCTKYDLNPLYDTSSTDSIPQIPVITTTAIYSIDTSSAASGGHIINNGASTITAKGVCWSTNPAPTTSDSITNNGAGSFPFTSNITGLTPTTKYYVRAYATNNVGTGYGSELSFTTLTPPSGTVTDIDGNVYITVDIGTQTWMASNLKVTKYQNGNLIGTSNPVYQDISGQTMPEYEWAYDGVSNYVPDFGRLYTWYTITDSRNVCPVAWHVPTFNEWVILINNVGGATVGGSALKEVGNDHWGTANTDATNQTGFTARASGVRTELGAFNQLFSDGFWWTADQNSASDAKYFQMYSVYSDITNGVYSKKNAIAVRCVKD